MYVSLDAFCYEDLIPLLQSMVGEDIPLTTETIIEVLKKMVDKNDRYKTHLDELNHNNAIEHLASWMYHTCNLDELCLITTEAFVANLCDTMYVHKDADDKSPGVYSRLEQILDMIFQDPSRPTTKDGVFITPTESDFNRVFTEADVILTKLETRQETPEEEELRKMFYMQLMGNELDSVKFTILDVPGKTVKYGNALITFPLILAKVDCYET